MDTEGVRLFVLAAEKLNISAAGRELGMAPAVASAKLAKLEKELGADLLRRSTRKVALSLEGEEFLPYAREILAQEHAAHAALGRGDATATGTLRFTAPSSFAQLYIAPILPEFLDAQPGIRLDLRLTDMEFDLIQGSFDLALRNAALPDSSLKGRKLADDLRILCASPEYEADDETALWLVYPKSNVLTAKVRLFIDFLLEKIGKAPVWMGAMPGAAPAAEIGARSGGRIHPLHRGRHNPRRCRLQPICGDSPPRRLESGGPAGERGLGDRQKAPERHPRPAARCQWTVW